MPRDELDPPRKLRSASLSGSIAWLSLLLLAAASGRMLNERWQDIWALAGAFGLAAAVGLGSLAKARRAREKRVRDLASRISFERLDGRLNRLNEQSAELELIDDAIRELTEHMASERQRQASHPAQGKVPQALSPFPLEVIPIENGGDAFDLASARSIAGSLRSISSSVVAFEHDQVFSECVVLLTFTLSARQKLCFVVDVMWTHVVSERFVSSGAVMAVGVPADQVSEPALLASGQE